MRTVLCHLLHNIFKVLYLFWFFIIGVVGLYLPWRHMSGEITTCLLKYTFMHFEFLSFKIQQRLPFLSFMILVFVWSTIAWSWCLDQEALHYSPKWFLFQLLICISWRQIEFLYPPVLTHNQELGRGKEQGSSGLTGYEKQAVNWIETSHMAF